MALTQDLRAAKCEVPDILVMTLCNRYGGDAAAARACVANMPADVRALVRAATHGSDAPLLTPLPHTQSLSRLAAANREPPPVSASAC